MSLWLVDFISWHWQLLSNVLPQPKLSIFFKEMAEPNHVDSPWVSKTSEYVHVHVLCRGNTVRLLCPN